MINNKGKDYKERCHDSGIAISDAIFRNIDFILAVEGKTDKMFYEKYTRLEIRPAGKIKNAHEKQLDCRSKIIKEISKQNKERRHWFGIIDADYVQPKIPSEIGNDVIFTDANSLETMLVKYSGKDNIERINNFEELIYKTNGQLVKKYCLNKGFVYKALEFSFQIGCLRKKNAKLNLNLNFKKVLENSNFYSDFLDYPKKKEMCDLSFDFKKYREKLIENSDVNEFAIIALKNVGEETFSIESSNWIDYCQGHDIIHFIVAMNNKVANANKELTDLTHYTLDYEIIKAYKKECFANSKIALWLKDKEKNKKETDCL